jgi:hypothetical protein
MRACSPLVRPLSAVALLAAVLPAQRNTAKVDWHERQVAIDYGVVRLGKHSLQELPPGQNWRMGFNEASVFRGQVPVCAGDTVVAPGSYRIEVLRKTEKEFALLLRGAGAAIAGSGDLAMAGEFAAAPKPNDKLNIDWIPADKPAKDAANLDSRIKVQFGAHLLTVSATVLGQKQVKVRGYTVDVFSIPAELLQARLDKSLPTPVATVRSATATKKNAPFWNLVLGKGSAALVPAMEASTDAFAEPKTPATSDIRKGTLQTADASAAKSTLEPGKADRAANGDISLVLLYGNTAATVVVPDPAGKSAGER